MENAFLTPVEPLASQAPPQTSRSASQQQPPPSPLQQSGEAPTTAAGHSLAPQENTVYPGGVDRDTSANDALEPATPGGSEVDREGATIELADVSPRPKHGHHPRADASPCLASPADADKLGASWSASHLSAVFILSALSERPHSNSALIGPGSWLSICSQPGVQWVSERVGSHEFSDIARGLIRDWTKHLTLSQYPNRQRGPELDAEPAWLYTSGPSPCDSGTTHPRIPWQLADQLY